MIKILFICHGNICRSTMAQFVFQHMVNTRGLSDLFHIDSAATSREEIGNGPHYAVRPWHNLCSNTWSTPEVFPTSFTLTLLPQAEKKSATVHITEPSIKCVKSGYPFFRSNTWSTPEVFPTSFTLTLLPQAEKKSATVHITEPSIKCVKSGYPFFRTEQSK